MRMMDLLRRPFGRRKQTDSAEDGKAELRDVRIAACALFLEMARAEPARWIVVDGSLTRARVSSEIWRELAPRLGINNGGAHR